MKTARLNTAQQTAGCLLLTSFVSLVALGVGCSAPAPDDNTNNGGNATEPTLPNKTKSDTPPEATPAPAPAPAPAPTPTPVKPPVVTPPVTPPADDTMACSQLGDCCQQLTDPYQSIACIGVTFAGDETACGVSLIACTAAVGLGGSSSGGMP